MDVINAIYRVIIHFLIFHFFYLVLFFPTKFFFLTTNFSFYLNSHTSLAFELDESVNLTILVLSLELSLINF